MPGVLSADFQLLLEGAERGGPFLSSRPRSWLGRVCTEGAFKQTDDIGWKNTEERRVGRRGDLQLGGGAAESKAEFPDRLFDGKLASH